MHLRNWTLIPGIGIWLAAYSAAQASETIDLTVAMDPATPTFSVAARMLVQGSDAVRVRLPAGMVLNVAAIDGREANVSHGEGDFIIAVPNADGPQPLEISYRVNQWPGSEASDGVWSPASFEPEGGFVPSRAWFPHFDPAPARYRLSLETPAGQVAVAAASLVAEERTEDGYRAVFEGMLDDGQPALFSGPYEIAERQYGAIRMRTYFHASAASMADDYFDQAALYLDDYQTLIGAYPDDYFFMISATLPVGLGFPGATYFSRRILPMPFMRTRSLAHEIAHNWWGNGVRPDYENGNWSEGLTTYFADYRLAEAESPAAAREMRLSWLRDYAALPAERDMPVTGFTFKEHDAAQVVGYGKVASIFHMLRRELGDAAFDAAVKAFWRDYGGARAGWGDMAGTFAESSGQDLAQFFDQWTRRRGAPAFAIAKAQAEADGDRWRVTATIIQGAPNYRVTVPVVVETDAGREETLVQLEGRGARTEIRVDARPRAVAIDPDYHLFRRLAPGEAPPIMRDVTLDEDALLVIVGDAQDLAAQAETLASRMLETGATNPPRAAPLADAKDQPVLLIGLKDDVATALANEGLSGTPETLDGRGTARAWVAEQPNGAAILAVAVDDVDALAALSRALPHYGGRSYVVFDAAKAIDKGLWSVTKTHRLRKNLD